VQKITREESLPCPQGLGRSTVIAFLNRLLRRHARDTTMTYEDKKTKREKRCHPKLVAQQQMSHRLKADLEEGKLSRVEFVTRHVAGGFEERNRVIPVTPTMVHKIVRQTVIGSGPKIFFRSWR